MKFIYLFLSLILSNGADAASVVMLNTCPCSSDQMALEKFRNIAVPNLGMNHEPSCVNPFASGDFTQSYVAKKGCGNFTAAQLRDFGKSESTTFGSYRRAPTERNPQVGEIWVGRSNVAYRVTSIGADPFHLGPLTDSFLQKFKASAHRSANEIAKEVQGACYDGTSNAALFDFEVAQLTSKNGDGKSAPVVPTVGSASGNSAWVTYLISRAYSACVKQLDEKLLEISEVKNIYSGSGEHSIPNRFVTTILPNFKTASCGYAMNEKVPSK